LVQLAGGMMLGPQRTFFPVYLQELGHPAVWIATLATVRQVLGMVASLIGGTLSDTLGRKWTLLGGQIGFLLASLAFLSPSTGWIAVLWGASGLGMGLHTLGGQSYLVDAARADALGTISALYNWGYTLGGALGSPLAGFLLDRRDYRTFGTLFAALALGAIAANVLALPQLPSHAAPKATAERRSLLGYRAIAVQRAAILLALLRFLPTFFWGMALVLIPLLLQAAGASKTTIAVYATASQVIAALAQIGAGRLADRARPGARGRTDPLRQATLLVLGTLVFGILGIAAAPGQLYLLLLFGTVCTAAAWSLSTLLPLWVRRVTPAQERGRVLGWIHLWWNAAMVIGAMTGGALVERWPRLPFVIAGALNLGTIALAIHFFRSFQPSNLPRLPKAQRTPAPPAAPRAGPPPGSRPPRG
jgi:MFS family permease